MRLKVPVREAAKLESVFTGQLINEGEVDPTVRDHDEPFRQRHFKRKNL